MAGQRRKRTKKLPAKGGGRRFVWCAEGNHEGCLGEYRRYYFEERKNKGRSKWVMVELDEYIKCGCDCHRKDV